jgi:hypothetical protein
MGGGGCPYRPTCVTRPEDSSGASCLAWPETAVAIRAAAPVATELYRRVLPAALLDGLKGIPRSSLMGQSPLPIEGTYLDWYQWHDTRIVRLTGR